MLNSLLSDRLFAIIVAVLVIIAAIAVLDKDSLSYVFPNQSWADKSYYTIKVNQMVAGGALSAIVMSVVSLIDRKNNLYRGGVASIAAVVFVVIAYFVKYIILG